MEIVTDDVAGEVAQTGSLLVGRWEASSSEWRREVGGRCGEAS